MSSSQKCEAPLADRIETARGLLMAAERSAAGAKRHAVTLLFAWPIALAVGATYLLHMGNYAIAVAYVLIIPLFWHTGRKYAVVWHKAMRTIGAAELTIQFLTGMEESGRGE